MKAVIVLVCFVALATAQFQPPTLQQFCPPDDVQCHVSPPIVQQLCHPNDVQCHISPPALLRSLPINTANVGNLIASIVQQIVDYVFPDGASLRSAEPTVEGIGKLVAWIVNKVIELLSQEESLRRMQNDKDRTEADRKKKEKMKNLVRPFLPLYPFLPVPPPIV
uniref:Secreted protein n=1 Tax=Anopheles funestus TaxID=62324 RepID=A0A182R595_ANOFN